MATVTHAKGKTTTSTVGARTATNAASMLAATQASITAKSTKVAGSGQAKAKDARPLCSQEGCKLHAADGMAVCSNHRPAHLKMAADDRALLSGWLTSLTPDERLIAFASVFGPVKSTELAAQLRSAGWSPATPKQ
jgi:hypothetical protein